MDLDTHLAAIQSGLEAGQQAIARAAAAARSAIETGTAEVQADFSSFEDERAPIIAGMPVDEPPPYIPPPMESAANALIPDTPLVEPGGAPAASLAFDDAPLWQS